MKTDGALNGMGFEYSGFLQNIIVEQSTIQVQPLNTPSIISSNRKIDPELYRNKIVLGNMECKLGRS